MGLGSTQVRFLGLIAAKNDKNRRLQQLSMQEMDLTREAHKISEEYQKDLNQKTLKWSQNNGLTYTDLTYSNLMRPSTTNLNWPYLITDEFGSVVVDDYYKEYADMLKENGGKYEGNTRAQMLAQATGIDINRLSGVVNNLESAGNGDAGSTNGYYEPRVKKVKVSDGGTYLTGSISADVYLENHNNADQEEQGSRRILSINIDSSDLVKTEDSAKNVFYDLMDVQLGNPPITCDWCVDDATWRFNLTQETVDAVYKDEEYQEWVSGAETRSANTISDAAKNASLTTDEIRSIEFYDALFTAMGQYGTKFMPDVSDKDYLNEMLMNNRFFITTVEYTTNIDFATDTEYTYYDYTTNIASNCTNVFKVNDDDRKTDALAKYEHKKLILKKKEQKNNTERQNLETELAAIKQMMESMENIKKENIERTFNIFS